MKAVALLSGGLDSILALKLILEQGIDMVALYLQLPFIEGKNKSRSRSSRSRNRNGSEDYASATAERLNIPLIRLVAGDEYMQILRNPKYGYGSGMNPCIDCHIYMLRKAKLVAETLGAYFIVTGDVLGERPMSQYRRALALEDEEAGVTGKVLRPLSAKLLPKTIPEREGWVDRRKLLAIAGKSRKPQIALAKRYNLSYPGPSGGCLLTYREFAARVRDMLVHNEPLTKNAVKLLKLGRHFRFGHSKIIVGRNQAENEMLMQLREPGDYIFEVQGYSGPVTLLRGVKNSDAVNFASRLTVRYSDADTEAVVEYRDGKPRGKITAQTLTDPDIARFRV